ncbi:cytosolic 5'-nucleotidase 1A-like [Epinephelus moara]|uniref:cytosolic 5'-nucleotidase 1A-like n=1 Tax=Epinephelus moara TaxID=300413 RepID=UPI00214EEFEA|nr:cytosolic 5'-nucleotidase 1A-like [Epinephelus moara]
MVSTIQNTDVKQKDADRAVVVAVTSRAVFESGAHDGDDVYGAGVAFPLLSTRHYGNLTFTIISSTRHYGNLTFTIISSTRHYGNLTFTIISSTRHYGLEVSRFCFSSEEDFIESLLKNNVQLFLSTDRNEAPRASQKGVLSALLDQQVAPSEQLRVMFCGDAVIRPDTDPMPASRLAAQNFSAQLGKMRQRFSMLDSPLSIVLVTSHGGRESCGGALRTLRSRGLSVDEAYCLAGAPRSPILSVLRTHFLLSDGFCSLEE